MLPSLVLYSAPCAVEKFMPWHCLGLSLLYFQVWKMNVQKASKHGTWIHGLDSKIWEVFSNLNGCVILINLFISNSCYSVFCVRSYPKQQQYWPPYTDSTYAHQIKTTQLQKTAFPWNFGQQINRKVSARHLAFQYFSNSSAIHLTKLNPMDWNWLCQWQLQTVDF